MGNLKAEYDPQNWKSTTWGELAELKYGKGLKGYRESKGEFPVYGTNGPVGWCDKPLCNYPSVIVGRKGAYRGIHFSDEPFYVIDTAFYIQPKMDFNLKWAYYSLLLVDINGMDSGSAIPSTSREDFYAIPVRVPPRSIQDSIVDQLDSLNSKIELNRQTNETLEKMAQALFKSWFVDFDPVIDNALEAGNIIPDELQDRAARRQQQLAKPDHQPLPDDIRQLFPSDFELSEELGWVPMGWKVLPFKKVIDKYIDNRGKTPPLVELGIPLVEVKHLVGNGSFPNLDTEKRVSRETFEVWFRAHLDPKDILISTVGTIGRTSFVAASNFGIAQNVLGLRFGGKAKPEYMFHTIRAHRFQHDMEARLVTTVQSSIKRKDLDTINILVPGGEVQSKFSATCHDFLMSQHKRSLSIKSLTKLRDILLPKLISGELRLPSDALPNDEQQVADATS